MVFRGFLERSGLYVNGAEIYSKFKYKKYKPRYEDVFARTEVIEGIHFMSLDDLVILKKLLGRKKDLKDIQLIGEFKTNTKQKTSFD